MREALLCLALLLACGVSGLAAGKASPYAGKKLIEYGWDVPTVAYVREHVREMEKVPFDGIVMYVPWPRDLKDNTAMLPWRVFSKTRFTPEQYEHAIADLKATHFTRFTDNFIAVITMPADVDWFDAEWPAVAHNAACMARVAKLGGCKGIMFDPENYGQYPTWSYVRRTPEQRAAHTYEETTAQVKQRGREFIRAINREYPDITILCLYGHSLPYVQSKSKGLENADYALLAPFYDGVCEAASPRTTLVDGFEFSYGYQNKDQFPEARKTVLEDCKSISTSPRSFAKHVRCGFGIWVDLDSAHIPWNAQDFSKNYWTPERLRASLAYAMESSDGYVWVYTERIGWWSGSVPAEYVNALSLAKQGPGTYSARE